MRIKRAKCESRNREENKKCKSRLGPTKINYRNYPSELETMCVVE